jgi:uncharacterized membrane protein
MIKPNKYTNVGLSVIGISFEIINLLKTENFQKYNQVLGRISYRKGSEVKINFLSALNFLYMLGKIQYHPKDDVIELLPIN